MKTLTHILTVLTVLLLVSAFVTPLLTNEVSQDSWSPVTVVYAQDDNTEDRPYRFLAPIGGLGDETDDGGREIDVTSTSSFPTYVQTMITIVIGFAIMAAIILIIASGFQYMTSTSQSGVSKAKEQIMNAILGLVLALSAVVILQTINPELIELNSVQTVTTSGESFAEVNPPGSQEFGGTIHDPDADTHGERYCMYVRGEWEAGDVFGWGSNDDRFLCYETQEDCDEGRELAGEAEQSGAWYSQLSCDFYYKTVGEVYFIGENEEGEASDQALGISVVGIDKSKAAAETMCRNRGQQQALSSVAECGRYVGTGGYSFDPTACEVRCEVPADEPAQTPESWEGVVWCGENNPEGTGCRDGKTACETATGYDCYRHPQLVYGKETDCTDCVFVDPESYPIKSLTCSPKDTSTQDYCRIKSSLSDKLSNLENIINNIGVTSPLTGHYEVTETFPPTADHESECHRYGSCVDVGLRKSQDEMDVFTGNVNNRYENSYDDLTNEHLRKIADFITLAATNDMDAKYEIGDLNVKNQLQNMLSELDHSITEKQINDNIVYVEGVLPHFSVYDIAYE